MRISLSNQLCWVQICHVFHQVDDTNSISYILDTQHTNIFG